MSKLLPCQVRIEDHGSKRTVTIDGPHMDARGLRHEGETFETHYSRELLTVILDLKGSQYFKDEIDRGEEPSYIRQPMEKYIQPITTLKDKAVLDFGCGGGASTVNLCRMGANAVHGVEISANALKIARLRARDSGYADQAEYHHVQDTTHLPFPSSSFDIIVCLSVFEHIPPAHREIHLKEIWRVLKKEGFLFILRTPNRLWPIDGHTTGLPFVHYLPLHLARFLSIHFSKRISHDVSVEDLVEKGIRGITYWEVNRALENGIFVPNDDVNRYFQASLAMQESSIKKNVKKALYRFYHYLELMLGKTSTIPAAAFLPYLSLCFRKKS